MRQNVHVPRPLVPMQDAIVYSPAPGSRGPQAVVIASSSNPTREYLSEYCAYKLHYVL